MLPFRELSIDLRGSVMSEIKSVNPVRKFVARVLATAAFGTLAVSGIASMAGAETASSPVRKDTDADNRVGSPSSKGSSIGVGNSGEIRGVDPSIGGKRAPESRDGIASPDRGGNLDANSPARPQQ